jgi:hypothetical protein
MKQRPPSRGEAKAAVTTTSAREIIAREGKKQLEKTTRLRTERIKRDAALDEALKQSFPASDSVEIGHSEHPGSTEVQDRSGKRKSKR